MKMTKQEVKDEWKETEGSDGTDYTDASVQAADRIKKNLLRYISIL